MIEPRLRRGPEAASSNRVRPTMCLHNDRKWPLSFGHRQPCLNDLPVRRRESNRMQRVSRRWFSRSQHDMHLLARLSIQRYKLRWVRRIVATDVNRAIWAEERIANIAIDGMCQLFQAIALQVVD